MSGMRLSNNIGTASQLLLFIAIIFGYEIVGVVTQADYCNYTIESYSGQNCLKDGLVTSATIIADGLCQPFNQESTDQTIGPGPYYKAFCPSKNHIAFLAASCDDPDCTSCSDNGRYRTNGQGSGWEVEEQAVSLEIDPINDDSGRCHNFPTEGIDESFNIRSNIPRTPRPTAQPTTLAPTKDKTPNAATYPPQEETYIDIENCYWTLYYYGSSNYFDKDTCYSAEQSGSSVTYDIVPDGLCQYNGALSYYRAERTECGIIFKAAHCTQSDCTNCLEYSSGFQIFSDCLDDYRFCGFVGLNEAYESRICYARSKNAVGHLGGGTFGVGDADYPDVWAFLSPNCQAQFDNLCRRDNSSSSIIGKNFALILLLLSVTKFLF